MAQALIEQGLLFASPLLQPGRAQPGLPRHLLLDRLQAREIQAMAIPIAADGAAGIALVQAILELTNRSLEPLADLGEEHP